MSWQRCSILLSVPRYTISMSTTTTLKDDCLSGRTCVQMTEHIMLLRDANTCRTWYNTTTVEASCALSRCSKQVKSLSVQSRYNAVEAWIVLRHRSHVRSKAVEHRRSVPEQRSVRRSCCGSLRGCWRQLGGTRNTDTANCSRDSGSAATGRGSTVLAIRVWMRSTQAVEVQQVPFFC